jgi:Fe-S cluster assembly ATPase SufC
MKSIILITHYQRLLDYIVNICTCYADGKIVKQVPAELALEIRRRRLRMVTVIESPELILQLRERM